MNILITSIGQRNYLVDHFKKSLINKGCQIYGADCNEFAPALRVVDKAFKIPPANSPEYASMLIKLCIEHKISGVLSINDLELPYLAKMKNKLLKNGIIPIVSDIEVIDISFDKYLTYQFLLKNNIPTPLTYLCTETDSFIEDFNAKIIGFPILSKPRKGSRSKGIHIFHTLEDLLTDMKKTQVLDIPEEEKSIYQEYIDSNQYSLHVFNDQKKRPVSIVAMVNLFKHMNGETFHIKTIKDNALTELGLNIANSLGHLGPLAVDVHKRGNEYVVLELNPRISGCYSLSHYAGVNFPGKIHDLIINKEIKFTNVDDYKDDVVMLKSYLTHFTTIDEIKRSTIDYNNDIY